MELGIKELSAKYYSYKTESMGKPLTNSGWNTMNFVCEQWLTKQYTDDLDPDAFVKRRLSFIELAFRERDQQVAFINRQFPVELQNARFRDLVPPRGGVRLPGAIQSNVERAQKNNEHVNSLFASQLDELNERLKQAGMPLHYHNGFIQIKQDEQVQQQIEQPFWDLLKDPKWKNVDIDMKEAIDRRDTGGRDPSFYAAKALESAIKIISDENGWTQGTEKGVGAYLNNLTSKTNGAFIAPWEHESMQRFYSDVRNDLGHGPGSAQMPTLTKEQIDQTIEFCMSWVKSLINRL